MQAPVACLAAQHSRTELEETLGAARGCLGGERCACFLAALGQRVTHFIHQKGEFEVLLEVHQAIEDTPNSSKASPAVSAVEHHALVHGGK